MKDIDALFPCNYASYASVAGLVSEETAGKALILDHCRTLSRDRLFALLNDQKERRLPFCDHCRGFRAGSVVWTEAAVQEDDNFALWT